MKVQVWREYKGNRSRKPIKEGVYDENDPRLNGLARYLIDNGNAHEYIEPEKPKRKRRKVSK